MTHLTNERAGKIDITLRFISSLNLLCDIEIFSVMQTAQHPLQIFFITSITLSDGSAHLMNRCSGAPTPKCERSKQKMQNF